MEYFNLRYEVNPNHPTYKSDGYDYTQPFPNVRLAYKFNDRNKLSLFYNRRVDRPNEVDIRIFPKYDDAEIIKVGNPALGAQFTNTFELGYKTSLNRGYFYSALYHRQADGTITRIASTVPGMQHAHLCHFPERGPQLQHGRRNGADAGNLQSPFVQPEPQRLPQSDRCLHRAEQYPVPILFRPISRKFFRAT